LLKIDRFVLSCQLSIFAASLINFLFNPNGLQVGDSIAYAFGSEENFQLLSFTGNSLRNWPIVLINLVLANSLIEILIQSLFSSISWCFLIYRYYKSRLVRKREFSLFSALLFMTSQNLTWNNTQLAESYSISFVVVLLALAINLISNKSDFNALCFILCSYFWASIHGRNFSTLFVFITTFTFAYLAKHRFKNLNLHLSVKQTLLALLTFVLLIHVLVVSGNQSKQEYETGLGYKALAYTYTFASQPEAAKVRARLSDVTEMKCLTLDGSADLYQLTDEMKTTCKSANKWLNEDFLGWYGKFLLKNPVTTVRMAFGGLLYGNQPPVLYGATLSILPLSIENVFFGDSKSNLVDPKTKSDLPLESKVNAPLLLWLIVLMLLVFYRFTKRLNSFLMNKNGIFILVAISAVLSCFLTILICPAESFKLTIQMQMLFFLSTSIVILNTFKRESS